MTLKNSRVMGPLVAIAIGWIAASTKALWISSGVTSNIAPMLWHSGSCQSSAPCAPGIFATFWAVGIRTRIWHGQMLRWRVQKAVIDSVPPRASARRSRANVSQEFRKPDAIGETTKMVKYKPFNAGNSGNGSRHVGDVPRTSKNLQSRMLPSEFFCIFLNALREFSNVPRTRVSVFKTACVSTMTRGQRCHASLTMEADPFFLSI